MKTSNAIYLTVPKGNGGSGDAVWGDITGTLANQTDLQTALNAKANNTVVVHLTEAETITGSKTFTANTYIGQQEDPVELGIVGDLNIQGDIIQNGSAYETHAEQLYTKKDYIILRDGAVSGLLSGEYAGLQFSDYDGTNTGVLVIDNTGTAMVGDEGDEQPLLTRESVSNLTSNGLLFWDATNYRATNLSTVTVDNSGNLTATSFIGDLSGNASTATSATRATQDGNGNVITSTYANQELNNLKDDGKDYINNSKALTTGNVSNNSEVYNGIINRLHTTFDLSKFTVVGTPTITDDGIASGFSTVNCVKITNPSFNLGNADSWRVEFAFETGNSWQTYGERLYQWEYTTNKGLVPYVSSTGTFVMPIHDQSGNAILTSADFSNNQLTINTKYYGYCEFTGTSYTVKIGTNRDNLTTICQKTVSTKINNGINVYFIGSKLDQSSFSGKIDLKHVVVIADGVTVFSGNKTDIDTIKPNDYTVVGSPTITSDGVASGFSANEYLYKSNSITIDSSGIFDVKCKIFIPSSATENNVYLNIGDGSNLYKDIFLRYNSSTSKLDLAINNGIDGSIFLDGVSLSSGYYNINFGYDGTNYYYKVDDILKFNLVRDTKYPMGIYNIYIGNRGTGLSDNYLSVGSIDLNSLKIYSNGNLIYQPCLKVPYTLTSSKDKIVDNYYIERVQDTYNQFGQALYFTIDENNQTFTLPMGDIYGFLTNLQMQIGDIATLLSEV